jgi:hypothetical protein
LQENHSYKPGGFRAGKHGSAPFLRFWKQFRQMSAYAV